MSSSKINSQATVPSRTHIPALTGFRALAAGMVLFGHMIKPETLHHGLQIIKYGWTGVNFFFALSGFLFTFLYFEKFTQGTQSLKDYFLKRLFRVYPLYIILLSITIFSTLPFGKQYSMGDIISHLTMTHGFFPQFRFSINPPAWTLSVEESFYLLIPLLFIVLGRIPSRKRIPNIGLRFGYQLFILFSLVITGYLIAFILVKWISIYHSSWNNTLWTTIIFGRFWDFACGIVVGLLVLYYPKHWLYQNRFWSTFLFFLGCSLFIGASFFLESHGGIDVAGKHPWFTTVVCGYALSGSLIILSLYGNSILTPFFENPLMVYLGKISFCLYLCQYLEIGPWGRLCLSLMEKFRNLVQIEWLAALITYLLTSLVAAFFYHLIEKPCQAYLTKKFIKKT